MIDAAATSPPVSEAHSRIGTAPSVAGARKVPGQWDMWAFVIFESLIFSSYFVIYMICRVQDPALFLRSQGQLNQGLGATNTLVLLTSSWFMALCVRSSRAGLYTRALAQVAGAGGLGLVFVGLKLMEWSQKIHEGVYFSTNEFFSFYYFLTAIHVLHVLIGFVVLAVAAYQLRGSQRRSQEIVETCATYWHMVDYLWIMIFALLYVMR